MKHRIYSKKKLYNDIDLSQPEVTAKVIAMAF